MRPTFAQTQALLFITMIAAAAAEVLRDGNKPGPQENLGFILFRVALYSVIFLRFEV